MWFFCFDYFISDFHVLLFCEPISTPHLLLLNKTNETKKEIRTEKRKQRKGNCRSTSLQASTTTRCTVTIVYEHAKQKLVLNVV